MISLKNISVSFDDKVIYKDFNIDFNENEITALLGKSGCGKTTLLKVLLNNVDYSGSIENNYNEKSIVYSKPRLITTMTVEENLRFILKNNNFLETLKELDLYDSKDKYPNELSSGMAQRVSLIRGLLYKSKILLMDEPFVNLDISLKYKLMDMFLDLYKKEKKTTIFISHDIDDAIYLADRIVIIDNSKIVFDKKNDKSQTIKNEILNTLLSL